MFKTSALFAAALSLAASAAVAAPGASAPGISVSGPAAPAKAEGPWYGSEYVLGDPKAPVTVVEYASVVCPHCARFDADVFPKLKAKYVDTHKARYVLREFLTPPEDVAATGFILARCRGEADYLPMVEAIFKALPEMFADGRGGNVAPTLMKVAAAHGISHAQFDACLNDPKASEAINKRIDQAIDVAKVTGTPTVFVNGRKVDPGLEEYNFAMLEKAIDPLLAKGGSKAAPTSKAKKH
jgi:protein-disulfide isomerase